MDKELRQKASEMLVLGLAVFALFWMSAFTVTCLCWGGTQITRLSARFIEQAEMAAMFGGGV